jgi:hypothetical protein
MIVSQQHLLIERGNNVQGVRILPLSVVKQTLYYCRQHIHNSTSVKIIWQYINAATYN